MGFSVHALLCSRYPNGAVVEVKAELDTLVEGFLGLLGGVDIDVLLKERVKMTTFVVLFISSC